MTKRLSSGSSPNKENKYKMHFAKLETKRRENDMKRRRRKTFWDSNAEWQKKKKMKHLENLERKRKKREQGGIGSIV